MNAITEWKHLRAELLCTLREIREWNRSIRFWRRMIRADLLNGNWLIYSASLPDALETATSACHASKEFAIGLRLAMEQLETQK